MAEKPKDTYCSNDIRKQSEEKAGASDLKFSEPISSEEVKKIFHELQVHQIELEMQYDELKRTQEKLEKYSTRYFDLYNLAPVGYLTINEKGLILEANLKASEMTGMTRTDLIMKPFTTFIVPECQDLYYLSHKKLFDSELPQICDLQMLTKSGVPFWARLESSISKEGEARASKIVMIDITESRLAQEEIKEQNETLSIVFENSPYIMILVDSEGRVININKKGVEFSGREKSSVIDQLGGLVLNCIHSFSEPGCGKKTECRECLIRKCVEATFLSGQTIQGMEGKMRFITEAAEFELDLLVSTSLIRQKNSGMVLISIIDRTEEKQIENAQSFLAQCGYHKADEDFFKLLAEYLVKSLDMDYVCIDELTGNNLKAKTLAVFNNGVFEENAEYSLKDTPCGEVVGKEACCFPKGVRHLFPKDDLLQTMVAESYIGITLWGFDGKPIGLIAGIGLKALANPGLAESILKLVGIRAAGELERRRASDELIKLEKQFVQAQKMEAIGRLAGGVAHDFNNMIGVILGYTDLMLMNMSTENIFFDEITEIQKAAERSKDLTQQLLAFSRQQAIELKTVDLRLLAKEIEKTIKRIIGEEINLVLKTDENLWKIHSDASQMNQIFMNLAVNAKDAMPDGGTLYIELSNIDYDPDLIMASPASEKNRYVLISVTDTGKGIDKDILPSIFEPFFTTKGLGKGTGLGLSTIYGIVRQNLGDIRVSSEPGLGTTFKIFLPAMEQTEIKNGNNKKPLDIPKGEGLILLLEDDELMLKMTKIMLGKAGYKVIAFNSPDKALVFCSENEKKIDLLLTDVVMPGMTGKDFSLRVKETMPDLKVIFMSGYTADIITKKGILDTDINYIQKPFTSMDLLEKINRVMKSETKRMPATKNEG